jgi:hypothetical protein
MNEKKNSTFDVIVGIAVIVTCIAAVLVVPEFRQWAGLEQSTSPDILAQTPEPLPQAVDTATSSTIKPLIPHTVKVYAQPTDGEALFRWCDNDWATCRNANVGNARWEGLQVSTIGATYDAKGFTIERAFLYFDTPQIPGNAVITSATLYLYSGQWQEGDKTIHVVSTYAEIPLTENDYSRINFVSGGSIIFGNPSKWENITLKASALDWIVKGGITKIALVHDNDLRNVAPSTPNNVLIATAEDQSHSPYLVIDYNSP